MSDWDPKVIKLGRITNLPNSDFLSMTTIMNEFPVIIRKGEFYEGQLVAYLCNDTIVPDTEMWHWLAKPVKRDKDGTILIPPPPVGQVPIKDRTIKAKKIRNSYSEGIIVAAPIGFNEGDSVVEYFELSKRVYEEELPETIDVDNEYGPKSFKLDKYDLEGLAKYGYVFEEGEPVVITEKIEGENCAFIYAEDRMWVKSRNWFKQESIYSTWWEFPHRVNLVERLKNFPNLVIYGESYGKVKGWKYDCETVDGKLQRNFRVFDVYDLKHKCFMDWSNVELVARQLELPTVPILYIGPWKGDRSLHELAEGISTIGSCVREGWVVRPMQEAWHEKLGRKILKLKGRGYKIIKD